MLANDANSVRGQMLIIKQQPVAVLVSRIVQFSLFYLFSPFGVNLWSVN